MMIPWMREKFAERRAKWLARSKRNASTNATPTSSTGNASPISGGSTGGSQETITTRILNSARTFALNGARTAETHTQTEETCIPPYCNHTSSQTQPSCVLNAVATATPPLRRCESTATNTEPEAMTAGTNEPSPTPSTLCRHRTKKGHTRLNPTAESEVTENTASEPAEVIIVRVVCPSSRILVFKVDVTKRLADLKAEVILELCDDPDSIQLFAADVRHLNPRYRLFRADFEGGELNESQTIAQLHIRDNESLMLAPRRSLLQTHLTHTREVPGPSEQIVEMTTRYLPSNETSLPLIDINEIFQQSNIQYDVRKVLISLAQVSATIIGTGPFAARLIAMLKQRLINKRNHLIDTLQCLVDMGFKREVAEYALKANNYVYSTTLEWLIQNQSEDSEVEQHAAIGLQRSQSSISPSTIVANNESIENTCALLEIVRIYSHRDVPPGDEIIESLTEMGFAEADVVLALKKTGNNKAAACEWLCGNRSGSVTELRDGLAADSPILKVILEMPQVQMNLANPKTFLAFLSILENEHAIRVWRGDSDTTSIITHILQKYHEEKHVLGINQFYGNR